MRTKILIFKYIVRRERSFGGTEARFLFPVLWGGKKGRGGESRREVARSLQENLINAIQGDNSVLFGEIPLNCPIKLVRAESSKTGK